MNKKSFLNKLYWAAFFPFIWTYRAYKKESKLGTIFFGFLSIIWLTAWISVLGGGATESLSTPSEEVQVEEPSNLANAATGNTTEVSKVYEDTSEEIDNREKDNNSDTEVGDKESSETTSNDSTNLIDNNSHNYDATGDDNESSQENSSEDTTTSQEEASSVDKEEPPNDTSTEEPSQTNFDGYTMIQVDGGDLSGERQPNVVVDIGFAERQYWAFTNEYGQLVKVMASEIILQDENIEPVTSEGRYYPDEAKVPGTESSVLDEGHVIADSLGGVANAYNITPQNSTLNRHGDQAYMEKIIRDAGGCTNFVAIITYPNTETQIPDHYTFTYTVFGDVIVDEFDNINPDEANVSTETGTGNTETKSDTAETTENEDNEEPEADDGSKEVKIEILALDKVDEYIIIVNNGNVDVNLNGWMILSIRGEQKFYFGDFLLKVGEDVKVGDSGKTSVDIHWLEGRGVWNNSKDDPAELYDSIGNLVDNYN